MKSTHAFLLAALAVVGAVVLALADKSPELAAALAAAGLGLLWREVNQANQRRARAEEAERVANETTTTLRRELLRRDSETREP